MMTRKTSTFRSSLKAFAILPFFLALAFTFGCEPASIEQDMQDEITSIEIVDSQTIYLNGNRVSASEFKSQFSDMPIDADKTIIDFKVHKDAPMELVTDVEQVLREKGTLRINYSTIQSNDTQSNETWRSKLKNRNILDLHINKEGEIIVNQDVTSLSSLNKLVKKFITNNGESASLSENSENAIIAIKTDKRTPYNTYISAIDKIMEVYDELRNQASMELYDKPFKSLEEGSKEKKKIESMYPKKISIKEPSRS